MEAESVVRQKLKVALLMTLFVSLAVALINLELGVLTYPLFLLLAILWLAAELRFDSSGKNIKNAFLIGLALMAFDFLVENIGGFLGYWRTHGSVFPLGFVPLEIMLLCVVGGMSWALYLPRRLSLWYSLIDIVFFSFFGSLGEALLIKNGLLGYMGGWGSVNAFLGYLVTWIMLHVVRYKVLEV